MVAKRRNTSGEGEGRREVDLSPKLSPFILEISTFTDARLRELPPSWPKENVVENRS